MRKLSKKYGGLQFFGAPSRGILRIYNNEGTKVFDANAYGGDSPYTISLQENIVTVQYTTSNAGVCLNGEPSVNTENISVTAEPSSGPTKTTIILPFAPIKIHFGSGTGEASVPLTNYVEVAQGASVQVTEYGENTGLYSGGGAILQYFGTGATRISVDLATAFPDKWAALDPGEHTIQIRAKNPGNYLDSDLSTAITFVKVVDYTITANLTNCTGASTNPTTIASNTTGTVLKFTANTGYDLPANVTVSGATSSWNQSIGELTLTKPTGNVTVIVVAAAQTYNITVNATNATAASTNPTTIVYGAGAQLKFTFPDGYFAPTDVTVTGATQLWDAATGALTLSNCTGAVTVTIEGAIKTYTITPKLTNCTWNGQNPTTIASNQFTPIELDIVKNTGWTLPTEISVSGVDAEYWSWNQATGTVTISHPQGNVTVTVDAVREVYNITTTLEHALAGTSNPTTIGYGLSATLTFTFPTGYEAPASVEVTGATQNWTSGTGTLVLSNPTGPVTVTVVGVATSTTLDGGTYKWLDNVNLTEWTQAVNFTSDGTSYKGMRYTGDGTAMTLQYQDADSEWNTVYNYNEDTSTGSWVNDAYKIVDLGTSAQTVTAIFKSDFIANTTKLTQLATPQNVTADGTNVSWDEVENATSYEVIEGGNNVLGTVKTSFVLSARNTDALVPLKYKKDGIVTTSDYDGILEYSENRTNIEGIKSYITFGGFGNGDTMPIAYISGMVNCTAEQVSDQVAKLTLTGDATATLSPSD